MARLTTQPFLPLKIKRPRLHIIKLTYPSNFIYMTGNSFQHFLTNESRDALFNSVKKHLSPKREFIFDTRNPILHELSNVGIFEELIESNGKTTKVISKEEYNHLTQNLNIQYITLINIPRFGNV